jgi:hypothetical protein
MTREPTQSGDKCETCEVRDYSDGSLIPVWESMKDYERGEEPDYLGCTSCHTMRPYPREQSYAGGGEGE